MCQPQVHVLHHMFPHNSGPVESLYTWLDAFRWLEQIAAALKYLHSLRPMVVHRDLKLENMLLTGLDPATADAKLADFGLCKLVKVGVRLLTVLLCLLYLDCMSSVSVFSVCFHVFITDVPLLRLACLNPATAFIHYLRHNPRRTAN